MKTLKGKMKSNQNVLNKGIIGSIAGGAAIIILFLVMIYTGLLDLPSQNQQTFVIKDVILDLRGVTTVLADEEKILIEVAFDAFNPNRSSVVLESIQYKLYADGITVAGSEIGERAEGFLTGTGKTFTMYGEFSFTLKDKVEVKKTELLIPLWNDLRNNDVQWRVSGTFFVTDPIRVGGKDIDFDFVT